jgi:hypothetical protein
MKSRPRISLFAAACILWFCFAELGWCAGTRIAILDFELYDLTLLPRMPAEIERTAMIKPLLESELGKAGYTIVSIAPELQKQAENGIGYLFEHRDAAAKLAKQAGADYVLVGRMHKPSFLFIYLMGHLVRTADARLAGDFVSEVKGSDPKLTRKGVENLAVKIDSVLAQRYKPEPSLPANSLKCGKLPLCNLPAGKAGWPA